MLVGEALIRWWNGTTFLPLKLGPTSERRASSPSLVFFQRGLRVLPWCSASLRSGGILSTPFILLSKSDFLRFLLHDALALKGPSSTWMGLDMLGRKYSIETIRYFDLVLDYMLFPWRTMEECVCMGRAFLLHLLGAYLFANGGKTVSMRWLNLFRDFGEARRAN